MKTFQPDSLLCNTVATISARLKVKQESSVAPVDFVIFSGVEA